MIIDELTVGNLNTNCYILSMEDRKDCVIIDPGAEAPRIRRHVGDRAIAAILLTHGHFDHIAATGELMDPGTELIIHFEDVPLLSDPDKNAGRGMVGGEITAPAPTRTVIDNEEFTAAGIRFKVLHTPGHTMGSVCYQTEKDLFTGDTLFQHGWGRTDLYSGDQALMMQSLRRLIPIARTMPIHPGHQD